jgi:hypothetical protein
MSGEMHQLTARGRAIEEGSFGVIDAEVGPHDFSPAEWQVVRREGPIKSLATARTLVEITQQFEAAIVELEQRQAEMHHMMSSFITCGHS